MEQEGNREVAKLEGVKKREVVSLGALAPGTTEQKSHRAARLEGLLAAKGLYHLRVQAGVVSQLHC